MMLKKLFKSLLILTLYSPTLYSVEEYKLTVEGTIEETFGIEFTAADATIQVNAGPSQEQETLVGDIGIFGNCTNTTMVLTVTSMNSNNAKPKRPILKLTPNTPTGILYDILFKGIRYNTGVVTLFTVKPGVYPPSPLKIVTIAYDAKTIVPGSYKDTLIFNLSVR